MRFFFVERVLQSTPSKRIQGIKHIRPDDYYLHQVCDGSLCFIPSLIGEAIGQLAAWNVMQQMDFSHRPVAGVVASAKMHRHVAVGETLLLDAWIDELDEQAVRYHGVAHVGSEEVFRIEHALGPLLPMADFISPNDVRRQFFDVYHAEKAPSSPAEDKRDEYHADAMIHSPPMVFDRILETIPNEKVCAEKDVLANAAYFPDHFPLKPVLPMTVLLQCIMNLAEQFVQESNATRYHRVREMRKIKMNDFVTPGHSIACTLQIKRTEGDALILTARCEVQARRVCVLELVLTKGDEI